MPPAANPEQSVGVLVRDAESGGPNRKQGGSRVDGVFYDAFERRDPAEREAALMAALPQVIAAAARSK